MLKYLAEHPLPRGARVICVELPQVFGRLAEVCDTDDLPDRVRVTPLADLHAALEDFNLNEYLYADKVVLLKALCCLDAHLPDYVDLFSEVQALLQKAKWTATSGLGNRRFVISQLENLAENRISSDCLRDLFPGKTAVILGVGPSLDDILPWVMKERERLVVIAVTRASQRLLKAGLVPDILVTIDPFDLSFDVSREMLKFPESVILAHAYHASPLLLGQWAGRSVYLGQRFPWPTPLNIPTLKLYGPTVTQTAIGLAMDLGVAQIVLGGVDLCFSSEGQIYGTATQGRRVRLGEIPGGVETNGGWRAETIHAFAEGAKITDDLAQEARARGCRVINSAAGAVKMAHVDFLPVEQIELPSFTEPASAALSSVVLHDSQDERLRHYRDMLSELERARLGYRAIERLAQKALKVNKALFSKNPGKQGARRLDKIENTLNTEFAEFSRFAKMFGALKFLRIVRPGGDDWDENHAAAEEAGRIYYESYRDVAKDILELLNAAERRLMSRQREESAAPGVLELCSDWEAQRLFGRVQVLQVRRPELFKHPTEEETRRLTQLSERFDVIMQRKENMDKRSEPEEKNYGELRAKAQSFFSRREVEPLRILMASLVEDKTELGQGVGLLAKGFLAELDDSPEQALQSYHQIIESEYMFVLALALVRIAVISNRLQDFSNLTLALECLAGLSPLYMTKYGDLLWLQDRKNETLQIYLHYLELVPNDLLAMLKLGRYYLDLGSVEGARMAFTYVLEKDPESKTAKQMLTKINSV